MHLFLFEELYKQLYKNDIGYYVIAFFFKLKFIKNSQLSNR